MKFFHYCSSDLLTQKATHFSNLFFIFYKCFIEIFQPKNCFFRSFVQPQRLHIPRRYRESGQFFLKPRQRNVNGIVANVLGNCVLYLQRRYIDCGMRNMHTASHYQNIILQAKIIQRAKSNQEMRVANNDVRSSVKYVILRLGVRIYFHSLRHRRRRCQQYRVTSVRQ